MTTIKSSLVVVPAYGRKYDSEDNALRDWNRGKDFKIVGGPYLSIRDTETLQQSYHEIIIIWSSPLQKVTITLK